MPQAMTSFGCALKTDCKACGGMLVNETHSEDGEWYHPWCSPSSKRKSNFREARDRLIEAVKRTDSERFRIEIADYDAARAALRYDEL